MEHVTVYTASNIPAAVSHPTINSLQWTEDGQLLFLTKTAVHILVSIAPWQSFFKSDILI
jgi:hypothetical protein